MIATINDGGLLGFLPYQLLLLFLFVILPIIIIVTSNRRREKIKKLMEKQADKRAGTIEKYYPKLSFSYSDLPVNVISTERTRVSIRQTLVTITLPRVLRNELSLHRKSYFTASMNSSYPPDFQKLFSIKTNDEQFANTLLNSEIQTKLSSNKLDNLSIQVKANTLKVSVPIVIKTDEEYDQLIDTALMLVDRVKYLLNTFKTIDSTQYNEEITQKRDKSLFLTGIVCLIIAIAIEFPLFLLLGPEALLQPWMIAIHVCFAISIVLSLMLLVSYVKGNRFVKVYK